ncbi:hypothetical protein WA026_014055 [Henosepilachna vigintioctopunctata]|uniref:Uncharacterized protein n=1 Tax=Henosepilachna vigintioctopunctata TaxID=420089 RepID=A0AAW1U8T8_9CUCU
MSLFDCQFIPSSSPNRHYVQNRSSNLDQYDKVEISGTNSEAVNDSSASYGIQEFTATPSPSNCMQKNPERKLQSAIYKGPDVFGKVLGPTADESILVGLQVLMDMAGNLEFGNYSPNSSSEDNPTLYSNMSTYKDSREASAAMSQSTASCQCYNSKCQENAAFSSQEIVTEVRRNPCQYIITQENIAASVNTRENKCQQSQTRVLPTSMICYNSDNGEMCDRPNVNVVTTSPNMVAKKMQSPVQANLRSVNPPVRRVTPPSSPSPNAPSNCPCSQFYHQTTTISVMENSPEVSPAYIPCTRKRSLSPIIDDDSSAHGPSTCDVSLESEIVVQQKVNVYPVHPQNSKGIKINQSRQNLYLVLSYMTLSWKPSHWRLMNKPQWRVFLTNTSKLTSVVRFSEEKDREYPCPSCEFSRGNHEVKFQKNEDIPVFRNKSCVCSLITNNYNVADAACSSLKVNISCQYHERESVPVESRSTQCGRTNRSRASSTIMCSESGDCQPMKKKSVRIISGPYDCSNFSETGYCMDSKKSSSRTMIPLLDCSDDISRICFEKPARVCLEMGDACIPPPMEIRYAITKITKFRDFSTFEVMKSTSKKPKCMPKAVEGVFVLKKEENCCCSKAYE